MPAETAPITTAPATRSSPALSGGGVLIHWLMLFAFWIILSGMLDPFHLTAGVLCTAGVAYFSRRLQLVEHQQPGSEDFHLAAVPWLRYVLYVAWLCWEIAIANWQVLRLVVDPKLPIDPGLVRFRSSLTSDIGKTALANSITLTPGTITVDISGDEFLVHALVCGDPVVEGISRMQRGIAAALPGSERAPEAPA